jgi:hypothetical protein
MGAVAFVAAHEPLDLEGHPERQAALGGLGCHVGDESPLAGAVRLALLCPALDRRPSPAGLSD